VWITTANSNHLVSHYQEYIREVHRRTHDC